VFFEILPDIRGAAIFLLRPWTPAIPQAKIIAFLDKIRRTFAA